jgi:hypothetical protein
MSEVEVPEVAVRAAYASPYGGLTNKSIRSVLELGSPLVVADRLRRIAADLYRRSDNTVMTTSSGIERVGTLRQIADQLSAEAAELDPQGGTR